MFTFIQILLEDLEGQKKKRFDFLHAQFKDKWTPIQGARKLEDLLDRVSEADPSKNGKYMPWIVSRLIKSPESNRVEDLDEIKDALIDFEKFKSKIANKDINSFKGFHDVYDAVDAAKGDQKCDADLTTELDSSRKDIEDVYSGSEGWIKSPKSEDAAIYLGRKTRWCTAYTKSENRFAKYNKNDRLFVIYDKAKKQRYQLHIDSDQFALENNSNVGIKSVPEWARKPIIDWYKKNVGKGLGLKHLVKLHDLGDHDHHLAKGTEHEEIFDLFSQYGI